MYEKKGSLMYNYEDYWNFEEYNTETNEWEKVSEESQKFRITELSAISIYVHLLKLAGIEATLSTFTTILGSKGLPNWKSTDQILSECRDLFKTNPDYSLKAIADIPYCLELNQSIEIIFAWEKDANTPSFTHITVEDIKNKEDLIHHPKKQFGSTQVASVPFYIPVFCEHYGEFVKCLDCYNNPVA